MRDFDEQWERQQLALQRIREHGEQGMFDDILDGVITAPADAETSRENMHTGDNIRDILSNHFFVESRKVCSCQLNNSVDSSGVSEWVEHLHRLIK